MVSLSSQVLLKRPNVNPAKNMLLLRPNLITLNEVDKEFVYSFLKIFIPSSNFFFSIYVQ